MSRIRRLEAMMRVMKMKLIKDICALGLTACLGCFFLTGCTQVQAEPDFSDVKEVAKLSALECYYHNVVKYSRASDGYLFNLIDNQKNLRFEYDGIVEMGLNVEKVSISSPDENGIVTITIPEVEILEHPDIDTNSMTDPIEINGWQWFNHVSADEKKQAITDAQNDLLEVARNDVGAKAQAAQRAKDILEQYVKNVGEAIGKTYTVKWAQVENVE